YHHLATPPVRANLEVVDHHDHHDVDHIVNHHDVDHIVDHLDQHGLPGHLAVQWVPHSQRMSVLGHLFQLRRIGLQHGDGVLPMSARGGHAMKRGLLGIVVALLVSISLGSAWAQFDSDFNHLECYSIKAAQPFERRTVTVETQ